MRVVVLWALLSISSVVAFADDDDRALNIDVGSTRIGGPGISDAERSAEQRFNAEPEFYTEDTVPPPQHPKRLKAQHWLAQRYFDGRMWKDACDKYDAIEAEAGRDGLASHSTGISQAARSFLECATIAYHSHDFDRAERLLKRSEQFAAADHRHVFIRRSILRDHYRQILNNGDIEGALVLFEQYQQGGADEDERIWLGEQLAKQAWVAYQTKDKSNLETLMSKLSNIAPMNTDYRKLKNKIEGEGTVLYQAVGLGLLSVATLAFAVQLARWRSKQQFLSLTNRAGDVGLDDDL